MEYILLLVITVAIILSLTNQFFRPFGQFVNNYMGDYISCLLETGEFPSTGNSSNQSECDFKFKPATLAEGRSPIGGSGSNPNDPQNESSKDKNGSKDNSAASGQAGYAGSAGQSASNLNGPPPRAQNSERAGSTKVVEISIGTTEEGGFNKAGGGRAYDSQGNSRAKGVITYGMNSAAQKKEEEEKKVASRVVASDLPGTKPKKMLLKPPSKADVIAEEKAENWNLGDYFRYVLIAAIIILLIAVIGGQAARLTKSWE